MFLLRGIAVSVALFWLSYCALSALVARAWPLVARLRGLAPRQYANVLMAARTVPLGLSFVGTVLFAAPSFILLEPRGAEEEIGLVPIVLSVCCVAFLVAGVVRAVRAQSSTSRVIAGWLQGARSVDVGAPAETYQGAGVIPPLTLAGVCRPRLLLSESALAALSGSELRVAVRHEIAHIDSHDNLKKLALLFAWFPGMTKLEREWQRAAELAADDAAAGNAVEALDLAEALIKLSRQVTSHSLPAISMGLVHDSFVSVRIARLLNWEEPRSRSSWRWVVVGAAVGLALITAAPYGGLLKETHVVTEWLVR